MICRCDAPSATCAITTQTDWTSSAKWLRCLYSSKVTVRQRGQVRTTPVTLSRIVKTLMRAHTVCCPCKSSTWWWVVEVVVLTAAVVLTAEVVVLAAAEGGSGTRVGGGRVWCHLGNTSWPADKLPAPAKGPPRSIWPECRSRLPAQSSASTRSAASATERGRRWASSRTCHVAELRGGSGVDRARAGASAPRSPLSKRAVCGCSRWGRPRWSSFW